jgi:hypothetical protein
MKRTLSFTLLFCSLPSLAAPLGIYQHGTVIRMHMGECALMHRRFVSTFGEPRGQTAETCPEYTLVTEKVVFVIVGRSSNQLVPLAEVVDFRFNKNNLAVRVDDAGHDSKFVIKEMILRSKWELLQKQIEGQLSDNQRQPVDSALVMKTR